MCVEQDLTDMGYQWPPVVARKDRSVLGSEFGVQPVTEVNQTAVALYENSASNLVDPLLPSWWCKQPDIILVIMYKKPAKSAADIALLDRAYRPMFHKVRSSLLPCVVGCLRALRLSTQPS